MSALSWFRDRALRILARRDAREGRSFVPKFPHLRDRGGDSPKDLAGATVLRIGTTDNEIEAGEFVIEYLPADRLYVRRLVLLFSEMGVWVEEDETFKLRRATQGSVQK